MEEAGVPSVGPILLCLKHSEYFTELMRSSSSGPKHRLTSSPEGLQYWRKKEAGGWYGGLQRGTFLKDFPGQLRLHLAFSLPANFGT